MPSDIATTETSNEPALVFVRLPEVPWTTYFDEFPRDSTPSEYQLVPLNKLILTKGPETPFQNKSRLNPVERAYCFMAALAVGVPGAEKRVPITVQPNPNGTFLVIDGNATTAVARILGWKELPVQIIKD